MKAVEHMWEVTRDSSYEGSIVVGADGVKLFWRGYHGGERADYLDWRKACFYPRALRRLGKRERWLRGFPTDSIPKAPVAELEFEEPT